MLMAPFALKVALPVALVCCTIWIGFCVSLRRHPATVSRFIGAAVCCLLALYARQSQYYTLFLTLGLDVALVIEVLKLSRLLLPSRWVCGWVIGLSTWACAILAAIPDVPLLGRIALFRQYFYIALFLVASYAAVYRLIRPLSTAVTCITGGRTKHPECFRHKALRVGTAAMLLIYAAGGTFVRGGLGYLIFPYTRRTYFFVEYCNIVALLVVVIAMTLGITSVPGRKRAALNRRGRAVTGLIEMERAA